MENNIQTVKHEKLVQLEDALHKARIISWYYFVLSYPQKYKLSTTGGRV